MAGRAWRVTLHFPNEKPVTRFRERSYLTRAAAELAVGRLLVERPGMRCRLREAGAWVDAMIRLNEAGKVEVSGRYSFEMERGLEAALVARGVG